MKSNLIKATAIKEQQRKPKYKRINDVTIRLQERDLNIILLIYLYRFLSSDLIAAFIGGSKQGVLRRLNLLFHAGFLDRPHEQVRPFEPGSGQMVYAVGNKGIELLHEMFGIPKKKVDWTSKNRDVKNIFLNHTLMIATFKATLKLACDRHGEIELIEQEKIVQGEPVLKININREEKGKTQNMRYNLKPDALFGLRFLEENPNYNKAYYFLEADRATQPIVRYTFLKRSFFAKKLFGYRHCKISGAFKKNFGFEHPRVLTVTTSQERINHMVEACRRMYEDGKASGMFLFTLASNFNVKNVENVLGSIWQTARDEKLVSLLD